MKTTLAWLWAIALGAAWPLHGQAQAQAGVTDTTILIGRSAGLTGSLAARMKPATEAMEAYFAAVNAAGGIHGRRLRLISVDDGNEPQRAAENTRRLVDEERVFVMFANSGTPQTVAAMKVLQERGVPLIGTTSGADSVQAHHPLLFHYKASYGQELARIATHLKTIGITRVALVYSPDPTGQEGRALAEAALKAQGINPLAVSSTKPEDATRLLAGFASAPPQAVVLTSLAGPGAAFFKQLVQLPVPPQVFTWSVAGVEAIHKEVGERIRGLVVSQVFPSPQSQVSRLAVEYRQLMEANKLGNGGYPGMEGYVSARILVEGLRRAGRELTRERLAEALRSLRGFDLGSGDLVTFGPGDHIGRSFVELTMVGANGKFVR
ncbi:MAG: ABC transporter substrate-binding protein [Burkholderiales bacterium]|nr:ABC transporter substrate-binding protein [Burkholderiales bacterium]